MTANGAAAPLQVHSAEYSAFGESRIVVEVTGNWLDSPPVPFGESALLIVDGNGLVHRFAEISASIDEAKAGDEYLGSFVIPAQFRRRIASPTALRAGGVTVTVPPAVPANESGPEPVAATVAQSAPPQSAPPQAAPAHAAPPQVAPAPAPIAHAPMPQAAPAPVQQPAPAPGYSIPPAGYASAPEQPQEPAAAVQTQPGAAPDHQVTVPPPAPAPGPDPVITALRDELRHRVAEETRMRREVSLLRTQIDARTRNYERLEQAQGELRYAVTELTERLEQDAGQRASLEASNAGLETANAQLAASVASLRTSLDAAQGELLKLAAERDAAVSELTERYAELAATKVSQETALEEVDELRRQLERGGEELADVRERFGTDEVEEAERLLAETRALTAKLLDQGVN